jgi:hypothetical protein
MGNETPTKYFDAQSGLWYFVHWDDEIKCYVWSIMPNQRLITDSTAK